MKIRIEEELNQVGYFINIYVNDRFVKCFSYDPQSRHYKKFRAYRETIEYLKTLETHYRKTIKEYAI